MQGPNRRYLPAIDHLRAFAALLIFYYHAYQRTYWDLIGRTPGPKDWIHTKQFLLATLIEGHSAVSLFLVISGFILTYGSLDASLDVKRFFVNRALRILPLLFAVTLVGTWMLRPVGYLIPFLQRMSPLDGGLDLYPWTGVSWSLAIEAQLYLIFPFVHAALRRGDVGTLLKIVALTYLLRLAGLGYGVTLKDLTYWTTLGHIEQFLAGAVAAWLMKTYPPGRWIGWLTPVCVLAITSILYGYHRLGGFMIENWWRVFFPTVEALMWSGLVVCWLEASRVLPSLISSAIKALGEVSYSIYLLHLPILIILVQHHWYFYIAGRIKLSILLSATVIYLPPVLLASWLTYTLIEKPFLAMRRRYVSTNPAGLEQSRDIAISI